MAVSLDVLVGPRLKVQRAISHIDEIIVRTNPLAREWYSVAIEPDIVVPYAQPSGFTLRYRPLEPIAELIALIIGDAVHNLRGALDHLATGIRQSIAWQSQGHFPMRRKREELVTAGGAPIPDLEAIEAALPGATHLLLDRIRPANGRDEPLWAFHTLNNDDKHNLILPTVAVSIIRGLNAVIGTATMRDCAAGGDATKPINLISADMPFTVEQNFETTVEVKFGQGTAFENNPVILTLTQIAGMISRTLDEFETLIRNSN